MEVIKQIIEAMNMTRLKSLTTGGRHACVVGARPKQVAEMAEEVCQT